MTNFAQALVDGLAQGSIYALLALGFVIIFKATQVLSFAQPALMVLGGLSTYHAASIFGWPFIPSLLFGIGCGAVIAMIVERLTLRPMIGKPIFTLAIITIGLDVILRVIANRYIGPDSRIITYPGGNKIHHVGGVSISQQSIGLLAITAVTVTGLLLFFRYSRTGLAMRATAFDQETAMAQGVRVGLIFALAWAIAGGLAAIAGTFIAAGAGGMGAGGLSQTTWVIALKALPAIIIGGLDSIPGSVVGGIAVGMVSTLTAVYQPGVAPWLGNNFALVAPYALMMLVLLILPYGLFGTKEVERV